MSSKKNTKAGRLCLSGCSPDNLSFTLASVPGRRSISLNPEVPPEPPGDQGEVYNGRGIRIRASGRWTKDEGPRTKDKIPRTKSQNPKNQQSTINNQQSPIPSPQPLIPSPLCL